MADNEIKTVITFSDSNNMDSQSTVEQIINGIEAATTPHIPLVKVVDQRGDEVWVNANHIREFKAYDPSQRSP
jgi:hypothetical protein